MKQTAGKIQDDFLNQSTTCLCVGSRYHFLLLLPLATAFGWSVSPDSSIDEEAENPLAAAVSLSFSAEPVGSPKFERSMDYKIQRKNVK